MFGLSDGVITLALICSVLLNAMWFVTIPMLMSKGE